MQVNICSYRLNDSSIGRNVPGAAYTKEELYAKNNRKTNFGKIMDYKDYHKPDFNRFNFKKNFKIPQQYLTLDASLTANYTRDDNTAQYP